MGLRVVAEEVADATATFASGAAGGARITVSGDRFTRVEGRSDFDAIAGASDSETRIPIIGPASNPSSQPAREVARVASSLCGNPSTSAAMEAALEPRWVQGLESVRPV